MLIWGVAARDEGILILEGLKGIGLGRRGGGTGGIWDWGRGRKKIEREAGDQADGDHGKYEEAELFRRSKGGVFGKGRIQKFRILGFELGAERESGVIGDLKVLTGGVQSSSEWIPRDFFPPVPSLGPFS